ncbi:hypothetical protein A2U01_0104617, partial [Trifolium medium]|nr:hypothetical protein [Trifolium medium]
MAGGLQRRAVLCGGWMAEQWRAAG